jgi:hypothetical protein
MGMLAKVFKEHTSKNYDVVSLINIFIFSDNITDYKRYIYIVLDTFQKYDFKLKERKWSFFFFFFLDGEIQSLLVIRSIKIEFDS